MALIDLELRRIEAVSISTMEEALRSPPEVILDGVSGGTNGKLEIGGVWKVSERILKNLAQRILYFRMYMILINDDIIKIVIFLIIAINPLP